MMPDTLPVAHGVVADADQVAISRTAEKPPVPTRIPSLVGLRALAIACVLFEHSRSTLPPGLLADHLASLSGIGYLGVVVFFVISGFIITRLLTTELQDVGRIHLGAFYWRRFVRIIPACYCYLSVVSALTIAGCVSMAARHLILAALFLSNYDNRSGSWFIAHLWSLSMEEQFYLCWPLTLALLGMSRATIAAIAVIIAMPVIRTLLLTCWPAGAHDLLVRFHTCIDPLMIGCLAALVSDAPTTRRLLHHLHRRGGAGILLLFIVPIPLLITHSTSWFPVIGPDVVALATALLLLLVIDQPHSLLGRCLNWGPVAHVGVISYGLYLYQELVLTPANTTWSGSFPLNFICAFAMAEISYWLFERPIIRRFRTVVAPTRSRLTRLVARA